MMGAGRRAHAIRLGVVVIAMFGFGYALAPMYDALCNALGINGKMALEQAEVLAEVPVDQNRLVTVEFVTTVNGGKPWRFQPDTPKIQVHPGQLYTVTFLVENTEDHDAVGQAVPNVAPWNAARHLRKTECFCFNNQPLPQGVVQHMPVRFMLDPELPADVDTVTLSYTFFDITDAPAQAAVSTTKL